MPLVLETYNHGIPFSQGEALHLNSLPPPHTSSLLVVLESSPRFVNPWPLRRVIARAFFEHLPCAIAAPLARSCGCMCLRHVYPNRELIHHFGHVSNTHRGAPSSGAHLRNHVHCKVHLSGSNHDHSKVHLSSRTDTERVHAYNVNDTLKDEVHRECVAISSSFPCTA
jgi:hypothetical protein